MIWKYHAFQPKMGKEYRGTFKGDRAKAVEYLESNGLEIIVISEDYVGYTIDLLLRKNLSYETLATFFRDFARMNQAGLKVFEIFATLSATTSESTLKMALIRINTTLVEGGTLKAGFEKSQVFSPMVVASIDAAEKSGSLSEVLFTLSDYFKYCGETRKRILNALGYPVLVFVAITIASIIISTKLIPQLKSLLPETATNSIPTQILLGYSWCMEHYWWGLLVLPVVFIMIVKYLWRDYSNKIMGYVYSIPRLGELLKEHEFSMYFMSLGVYLKSGIVLNEAITNIHLSRPTYITKRFICVRDYVLGGMSFWSAVERDKFFPIFINNNLRKGEEQGRLKEYVFEIYRYYEDKSRETINIAVALVNPALLILIVVMVLFLVFAFFVPLYSGFGTMADQVYK